ncbi:MAG TPA: TauD/TfdA family dioxygenase [Stellaceae bacterium]|jgi:taurine dioxygenase|nr:TauD/TfdA family dioxygenase [Stellaceae bacterium]
MAPRQTMEIHPLSKAAPGVEVTGLDARSLDDATIERLKAALAEHGVAVLRGQSLTPASFAALGRQFGQLEPATREQYWHPEQPEVYVISNVVVNGKLIGNPTDTLSWHTDQYYLARPTAYTLLYGIETPAEGADTMFASTRRAFDSLPAERQARLSEIRVRASHGKLYAGKLTEEQIRNFPDVVHPLVRVHPVTGAKFLYFANPRGSTVIGMSDEDGLALLREMFAITTPSEHVYSHKWRPQDLVIWDNRGMLHTATPYDKERYRRIVHRVSVVGEVPICATEAVA